MTPLVYLLLASLVPPTWAATPTRRPGGRKTRDRKVENFPDSSIYRAKTFRTGKKWVNQIFAIKIFRQTDGSIQGLSVFLFGNLLPNFLTACRTFSRQSEQFTYWLDYFQSVWTLPRLSGHSRLSRHFPDCPDTFQPVWTLFSLSGHFPEGQALSRMSGFFSRLSVTAVSCSIQMKASGKQVFLSFRSYYPLYGYNHKSQKVHFYK